MIERSTLDRIVQELCSGKGSPTFMGLMDDRTTWTVSGQAPWSGRHVGARAIREALLHAVYSRLTRPFTMRVKRTLVDGEMLAIEGKGDNELKEGGRYDNEYVLICRFEGPRLAEVTEYCDLDLVGKVLGPPPHARAQRG